METVAIAAVAVQEAVRTDVAVFVLVAILHVTQTVLDAVASVLADALVVIHNVPQTV